MKKLSEKQQEVVATLKSGDWSLWSHFGFTNVICLQKGKPQCGGESRKVLWSTVYSLLKIGLLKEKVVNISTRHYFLTPLTYQV